MEENLEQNKSRLSSEYDEAFFQMLQSFQNNLKGASDQCSENTYSFLYPSFGDQFFNERKILIYGQCLNGKWKPTFNLKETINRNIIDQGWEFSNTVNPGEASPLDWVNKYWLDYSMYRSFFWNVAYKLTNKIMGIGDYKNSEGWSKYMGWSNLMKIGNVVGKNPNPIEYDAQIKSAIKLFKMELDEIRPEIVILLAGTRYGSDFIHQFGLEPNVKKDKFVIATAKVNESKLILTTRPKVGSNEKCVEEIIETINQF